MPELFLNAAGTLFDKTEKPISMTIRNYPVRSCSWKLEFVCCDSCRGNLAVSDERGQVFLLSVDGNEYRLIRKASSPVTFLAFVLSQPHHLLVAYENGELLSVNTVSGNVIKLISSPQRRHHHRHIIPCIRLLRTHPTQPLAVFATDDVNQTISCISLWDMSRSHVMRCLRRLPCDHDDSVVDVQFELGGLALCVVLQRAGACLYRSADCSLAVQCAWPRSSSSSSSSSNHRSKQKCPIWTAYASIPTHDENEDGMRVVLAGDDGSIHMWEQINKDMFLVPADSSGMTSSTLNEKTEADSATMVVPLTTILLPCLGVVEMMLKTSAFGHAFPSSDINRSRNKPMHTNSSIIAGLAEVGAADVGAAERLTIISMVLLAGGDSDRSDNSDSPRLAMLTSCGRALVVEIEGVCEAQGCVGIWTVLADWSTAEIQGPGTEGTQGMQLPAFSLPRRDKGYLKLDKGSYQTDDHRQHQQQPPPLSLSPCSRSNSHPSSSPPRSIQSITSKHQGHARLGWMAVARIPYSSSIPDDVNDIDNDSVVQPFSLCVVGTDGALRWLDVDAAIGHGAGAGQVLPVRGEVGEMGVLLGAVLGLGARENGDEVVAGGKSSTSTSANNISRDCGHNSGAGESSAEALLGSLSLAQALVQRRRDQQQQQLPPPVASPPSSSSPPLPSLLSSQPLFDLAAENHQVTDEKLQQYLRSHPGGFPGRYRPMLWRLLLRLPDNVTELASISLRGTHPAYRLMHRDYPVGGDHRLFLRLQAVCSNLAHWTPLLAEVPYLPELVYPFVLVFGSNEVAATETVMTLLLWWGHSWLAMHPHPPVHITNSIDALLRLHDPLLHTHLHSLAPVVSPGLLGWSMLSSLFTNILPKRAWLSFMDFLFAHIEHCALALLTPVALLHGLRKELLAASDEQTVMACCHCHAKVLGVSSSDDVDDDEGEDLKVGEVAVHARGHIDMMAVRATLLSWLDHTNTPPEYLTAVGPMSEDSDQNEGSDEHKDKGSTAPSASSMHACVNRSCGHAFLYLPPFGEKYPVFEGLPRLTHDWQIAQREQVLGKEAESMATTSNVVTGTMPSRTPLASNDAVASGPGLDIENEEHHRTNTDHQTTKTMTPRLSQEEEERQQAQLLLAARRLAIQEQELAAGIAAEERMWEARLRQEEGLLAQRRAERTAELDRDRALVAMQTDMAHRLARLREERDVKVVAFERARCDRLAVEDQEARQHALARQKLLAEKEELTRQLRLGQGLGLGLASFIHDGESTPMDSLAILTPAMTTTAITTTESTRVSAVICGDKRERDGKILDTYTVVTPSSAISLEIAPISPLLVPSAVDILPVVVSSVETTPAPPVDRSRSSFQVAMRRDKGRAAANRAAAMGGGGGIKCVDHGDVVAPRTVKASGSAVVISDACDDLNVVSSHNSVHIVDGVVNNGGASDVNGVSLPPSLPPTLLPSPPLLLQPSSSPPPPPPPSSSSSSSSSSPSSPTTVPPPFPPHATTSLGSDLMEEIKSFRGTFDFTTTAITSTNTRHPPVGQSKPWVRPVRPARPVPSAVPSRGSGSVSVTSELPLRGDGACAKAKTNLFGPSPSPRPRFASTTLARPLVSRAASTARPTRSSRPVPRSSSSGQAPIASTPTATSARRQPFIVITTQPRPRSRSRPDSEFRASGSWIESPPQNPLRADENTAISSRQSARIDRPATSPYPQQGQPESIGIRQGLPPPPLQQQGQTKTQEQGSEFSRNHSNPTRRRPVHTTGPATTNHASNHPPAVSSYTSPSRQGLERARSRPSPDQTKWTQSLRIADEETAAAITLSPSRPRPPFVVDISLAPDIDTSSPHACLRGSKTHYHHLRHPTDDPKQPPPLALVSMVRVGASQLPSDWTPFMGVM